MDHGVRGFLLRLSSFESEEQEVASSRGTYKGGTMSRGRRELCFALIAALVGVASANAQESPLPHLSGRVDLPKVEGRIDHFSADIKGERVFMSALGNHTVEVIDAKADKRVKTLTGLAEPQGVLYDTASRHLFVACAEDGSVKVYDGASYQLLNSTKLSGDSDNIRYDARGHRIIIGYGDGALAFLDSTGKETGEIPMDGHPESFQLEKQGSRLFLNVPSKQEVEVADLSEDAVVARWRFKSESRNYPMALDEAHHRLLVGFRSPARLLVINTDTGQTVASVDIVGDTDDLFYDAARRRIYVIGGEGFVDIIGQKDPDHYEQVGRTRTAPGARTGFFVPDWNKLFVAVPHRGEQHAEVLVIDTK
jgi:DNA-binding beta-propeller fold protein YncE